MNTKMTLECCVTSLILTYINKLIALSFSGIWLKVSAGCLKSGRRVSQPSCQKATAAAAATLSESTPGRIGILTQ